MQSDLFKFNNEFDGPFAKNCQSDSVPDSLFAPMNIILQGLSVQDTYSARRKASLSLSQLVIFRTVDTDVVALAVKAAAELPLQHLRVAFGSGLTFRYIPVHDIASLLGPSTSKCVPLFHAMTVCDTVSSYHNIGKKEGMADVGTI